MYPGCRVDNPNHNYSYSFAQRHDWPFRYSTQDVLHDYFRACANEFGITSHIRFNAEMGLLLAIWMGVSYVGSQTLLPVLILVFKPKFIMKESGRAPAHVMKAYEAKALAQQRA